MFESIKRARDAKRREVEATEKFDAGRRDFLRGAGATVLAAGVASAIPTFLQKDIAQARGIEGDAGIRQRERLIDETVSSIRRAIDSPDVRECLEGKGTRLITRLLQAMQHPIEQSFVKDTKYDATEERMRYCLQFAYPRGVDGKNQISLISARVGERGYVKPPHGNGFYFGNRNKLVTANHVLADALDRPDPMLTIDMAVVPVSERAAANPDQVIEDDTSLNNADIHNSFVTVEGIDPDSTSTEGCKSYPGVAVKLSRAWVEKVFANSLPQKREQLARSFAMLLPPGEATGPTAAKKPTAGMSGSPVFTIRNGRKVLAGIFYACATATDETGRSHDLAFFHGIEEIRESYAAHLRNVASR